jgi:glycosyltransferase involved in cell wall biosynthesis
MKILFFFENNWVFGKIHNELSKALYPEIYCDVADWSRSYTLDDFSNFLNKYDYIMTVPDASRTLVDVYKVPHERIIVIAHGDWDIFHGIDSGIKPQDFTKFKGYCVISPRLINVSVAYKIPRIPKLLKIGLFTKNYPRNTNTTVNNIGFFSVIHRDDCGFDLKRGSLVKHVSETTNLPFIHSQNLSFLGIEKAYSNVSLVMFASLTEGNPYSSLEAFACGIPVLGTNVGIFPDIAKSGGGTVLSFEEDLYSREAYGIISEMTKNKCLYYQMSEAAYEESKNFDWSVLRETWINYFNSL